MAKQQENDPNELNRNINSLTEAINKLIMAYSSDVSTTRDIATKINSIFKEQLEESVEQHNLFEEQVDMQKEAAEILSKILEEQANNLKDQKEISEVLSNLREGLLAAGSIKDILNAAEKSLRGIGGAIQELEFIKKQDQKRAIDFAKNNLQDMILKFTSGGFFKGIFGKILEQVIGKQGAPGASGRRFERLALALAQKQHPKKWGLSEGQVDSSGGISILNKVLGAFAIFKSFAMIINPILEKLIAAFKAEFSIASDLSKITGFTQSTIGNIGKEGSFTRRIRDAKGDLESFGISLENVNESATSISFEFKNINALNSTAVVTMAMLQKRTGLASAELTKIYKTLSLSWKGTNRQFREFTATLSKDATKYGKNFSLIMRDIAENSEQLSVYFNGSKDALEKAVFRAHDLNSTLTEQLQISGQFGTWADSIQKSFMLSALAATPLNAKLLYMNEMTGKAADNVDYILDKLIESGNRWKQNTFIFKETAKTLGLTTEQLNMMVEQRKELNSIISNKNLEQVIKSQFGNRNIEMRIITRILKETAASTDQNVEIVLLNLEKYFKNNSLKDQYDKIQKEDAEKTRAIKQNLESIQKFGESLDIKSVMSPQEKLLGSIAQGMTELVQIMTDVIVPAVDSFANLNPIYWAKLAAQDIAKNNKNRLETGIAKNNKNRLETDIVGASFGMEYKANGGIVDKPVIAGEAGPEVILPLTGPGVKQFTKPFLGSVTQSNNQQTISDIAALKKLIEDFSKKPVEVNVYLDGRRMGQKLQKYLFENNVSLG